MNQLSETLSRPSRASAVPPDFGVRPPRLHLIRIFSDEDVPSSVRSAMFIVTPTPDARPSSFWSGMNGILHPTALQWWGRQRQPMPLRWSLADPVASLAINMPLQKELFASSRLPRRRRLQICGFGNSEAIERLVTELSPNCHQIVNNLAWKTVVFQRANS